MRAYAFGLGLVMLASAAVGAPSPSPHAAPRSSSDPSRHTGSVGLDETAAASHPDAPAAKPEQDIVDVGPVLVSGQQSGPALWKVSHGANVLWILGTVSPVPPKMDWYSPQAEQVLAQAAEIIGPPSVAVSMGAGGMFKAAFALPTLLKVRNNRDGAMLRDVLPADLYARWQVLKPLYLGRDQGVEKMRPFFAASELYDAAIKRSGLQAGSGVGKRLSQLVKQHGIKRTSATVVRDVKNPRALAKTFARSDMDDTACFRSVLDHLEADVAHAAERANAWAAGDLQELSRLMQSGHRESCMEAFTGTEAARSLGLDDGDSASRKKWFDAVDMALRNNAVSFATLPIADLLDGSGTIPTALRARGYQVEAPLPAGPGEGGAQVGVDDAG